MNPLKGKPVPKPGQIYTHYKGGTYEFIGAAITEDMNDTVAVYLSQGTGQMFTRPLRDFVGEAKVQPSPGKVELVQRFKLTEDVKEKEESHDDPSMLEELMQVRHEHAQAAATIERLKVEKEAIHDLRGRNTSKWKIPQGIDSVLIDTKVYEDIHEKLNILETEILSLERLNRRLAEAKQEVTKQRRSLFPDKFDININVNGNISDEVIEKAMKQLEEKYKKGGLV